MGFFVLSKTAYRARVSFDQKVSCILFGQFKGDSVQIPCVFCLSFLLLFCVFWVKKKCSQKS